MASEPPPSVDDLERWPPFIEGVAADALGFAANHPRAALSQARVVAEAVCSHVYRREIGEPGKLMLDELVRKLAAKKLVSPQLELPLRTVQAWGNYGAHPIDFAQIDGSFVAPCMAALRQVLAWYFVDYLGRTLPPGLDGTRATPARGAAIVVVSSGRRYPLVRGASVLVGRDPDAAIQLDEGDLKVHRKHARIDVPASGPPMLHELGGKNPTRVNDERIAGPVALRHGDHVQLGRTILRVELDDQ